MSEEAKGILQRLKAWTDADLFKLREAISDELTRRWLCGNELEAKAKAAERMYDD